MSGINAKKHAEVKMVTPEGLYLVVEDKGFFASFANFPYLADLPSGQVFQIAYCGHGHIRWEEADIDLHTKILEHPEDFPIRMQPLKLAAAVMGRRGGSVKSIRKALSSATNGRKGGRPHKDRALALT
ncbi:MAG: DUF2442 domain-containing protein [Lentisphaerae bacterium]|nr:DUF2442 domain-containing protein [Lentisphaerota bacterium]